MNLLTWLFQEYQLIATKRQGGRDNPHPPTSWSHGNKGDVLLIHGLHERWFFFKTIGDNLNSLGYRIHTICELENNTMPLQDAIKVVEKYIQDYKLHDFITIGHSKGGLIATALLKTPLNPNISKIITIATPFHGTVFAYLKKVKAPELIIDSPFISQLTSDLPVNKITNLYPALDNHVIPNSSLILAGAANILIPVYGHTRILDDIHTQVQIQRAIA